MSRYHERSLLSYSVKLGAELVYDSLSEVNPLNGQVGVLARCDIDLFQRQLRERRGRNCLILYGRYPAEGVVWIVQSLCVIRDSQWSFGFYHYREFVRRFFSEARFYRTRLWSMVDSSPV